ncbi:MAG: hypothetical protein EH225_08160, partial [Calditrichaeota bacterium]
MNHSLSESEHKFQTISSFLSLGILSLGLQILFIRGLLEIFLGNELTLGLFLAVWMLGTALGSHGFSAIIEKYRLWTYLVISIFPVAVCEYVLIRFIPAIFNLTPGAAYQLVTITAAFLLTVLPVSLLCGALFTFNASQVLAGKLKSLAVPTVYVWESAGSLIIALLLNFILFQWITDIQILFLCLLLFYLAAGPVACRSRKLPLFSGVIGIYIVFSFVLFLKGNLIYRTVFKDLYAPYMLMEEKSTPYGRVRVMQLEDQQIVYHQGIVTYTSPDPVTAETGILLPVLSASKHQEILVLGGNLSEYLRYLGQVSGIRRITYLEKDPY